MCEKLLNVHHNLAFAISGNHLPLWVFNAVNTAIRAINGDLHAAGCNARKADMYQMRATCNDCGSVAVHWHVHEAATYTYNLSAICKAGDNAESKCSIKCKCRHTYLLWDGHSSTDYWDYFQTPKGHMTWII